MRIEDLHFTDVSQKKLDDISLAIYFKIDDFRYRLFMVKRNGLFKPGGIQHLDADKECPLCKIKVDACNYLFLKRRELFLRLIEFPNIRLEWLYIPHV